MVFTAQLASAAASLPAHARACQILRDAHLQLPLELMRVCGVQMSEWCKSLSPLTDLDGSTSGRRVLHATRKDHYMLAPQVDKCRTAACF